MLRYGNARDRVRLIDELRHRFWFRFIELKIDKTTISLKLHCCRGEVLDVYGSARCVSDHACLADVSVSAFPSFLHWSHYNVQQ